MEYSYYETRDIIVVSIYGPPECRRGLGVVLKHHKALSVGLKEIKLFKRVNCIRAVHADAYKTEVVLEKEVRERWNCLNKMCRDKTYSPPSIDFSEINAEGQKHNTLEALFHHIYETGSDDQKRAMNKSFVESGGTVLCTTWVDAPKP